MSDIVFSSELTLVKCMEGLCTKAVRIAANRLLGKLQEYIISEYYEQYDPDAYKRTMQFFDSAVMNMLGDACAEILMDENKMNYGKYWDGETQINMAASGYHGTVDIQTKGRFWDKFENYCTKNAKKILKEELKKQGINIK